MVITGASHVPNRGSSPRGGIINNRVLCWHKLASRAVHHVVYMRCQFDAFAQRQGYGPVHQASVTECLGAVGIIGGGFGPLFWIANHGNKRHSAGLWPIQKILEVLESREMARSNKGIIWEIDHAFWKVTGTYVSPCILQSLRGEDPEVQECYVYKY